MKGRGVLVPALGLILLVSLAFSAYAAELKEFRGVIIDNACATAHQKDLAKFIKTHPKSCVLKPDCKTSGMLLYLPDGKLLKFDQESSNTIVSWLENNNWTRIKVVVKVEENKGTDTYYLASIDNQ